MDMTSEAERACRMTILYMEDLRTAQIEELISQAEVTLRERLENDYIDAEVDDGV